MSTLKINFTAGTQWLIPFFKFVSKLTENLAMVINHRITKRISLCIVKYQYMKTMYCKLKYE